MRLFHHKSVEALGQILLELILVMPVMMLITVYAVPTWGNGWFWFVMLPSCALFGWGMSSLFHFKKEALWLIGFLLCTAGIYIATGPHQREILILYVIGYAAFARGYRVTSSSNRYQFIENSTLYTLGLILYVVIFILSLFLPELKQLQGMLAAMGAAALLSVAFLLNRRMLGKVNYSDMNQVSVPQHVLHMNKRYVMIFLAAIFTISLLIFSSVMGGLWRVIRYALSLLSSQEQEPVQEEIADEPVNPLELLPIGEEQGTSPFWEWMEKIMIASVYVLLVCAIILLIVWLFRNLIQRWFPRLWAVLKQFLTREREEAADEDYRDEHFNTLEWDKLKNELKLPFHQLIHRFKRKPEKLSDYPNNRERVRFLYRSKLREAAVKGYEPLESHTSQETLAEIAKLTANENERKQLSKLALSYDAARYGDAELKDDQVQPLLQTHKNKK